MLPGIMPLAGGFPGNDAFATLLLKCDDASSGTSFPDASSTAHSVTATNATTSTTQTKFGVTAANFNGTTAYLSFTDNLTTIAFGTGDFTIDLWLYSGDATSDTNFRRILSTGDVTADAGALDITVNNSGNAVLFSGAAATAILTGTSNVCNSVWHHLAITRSGTSLKLFIDGAQEASATDSTSWTVTTAVDIGRRRVTNAGHWNGYLDEIRVSKGIARWTAAFTPPNRPYV